VVEVVPFVVGEVAAFLEAHREDEADSVLEGAADPDSLVAGVVAFQGVHREDVVGLVVEEVRNGTSQNGVPGVLITCLFEVFCVQKSQLP